MYTICTLRGIIQDESHKYIRVTICEKDLPDVHGAGIKQVFVFLQASESEETNHDVPAFSFTIDVEGNNYNFWKE